MCGCLAQRNRCQNEKRVPLQSHLIFRSDAVKIIKRFAISLCCFSSLYTKTVYNNLLSFVFVKFCVPFSFLRCKFHLKKSKRQHIQGPLYLSLHCPHTRTFILVSALPTYMDLYTCLCTAHIHGPLYLSLHCPHTWTFILVSALPTYTDLYTCLCTAHIHGPLYLSLHCPHTRTFILVSALPTYMDLYTCLCTAHIHGPLYLSLHCPHTRTFILVSALPTYMDLYTCLCTAHIHGPLYLSMHCPHTWTVILVSALPTYMFFPLAHGVVNRLFKPAPIFSKCFIQGDRNVIFYIF